MPLKNQAMTITYLAWDTVNNIGKTGDSANHTIRGVGDGSEFTPAASPAEVDATNLKGVYKIALAAGETNYDFVTIGGISSTSGIVIYPVSFATDRGVLPSVTPTSANGFITRGTGAGQLAPDGGGRIGIDWSNVGAPTTLLDLTQTTIKNLDGNTVQTGDSFARIGATGSGLTSLAPAATALSTATWTAGLATQISTNLDIPISDIPTANENADGFLDRVDAIEIGVTPRKALRAHAAGEAGNVTVGAGTVAIAAANNSGTPRIAANVDSVGNRTITSLTL